ncbi:MAG: hypothetical protein QW101_04680 [Ignisphaera sp.]
MNEDIKRFIEVVNDVLEKLLENAVIGSRCDDIYRIFRIDSYSGRNVCIDVMWCRCRGM